MTHNDAPLGREGYPQASYYVARFNLWAAADDLYKAANALLEAKNEFEEIEARTMLVRAVRRAEGVNQ